jgi:hypothetical protein
MTYRKSNIFCVLSMGRMTLKQSGGSKRAVLDFGVF